MYATTLRTSDAFAIEDWDDAPQETAAPAPSLTHSSYDQAKRPNFVAIAILVVIHIGLLAMFTNMSGWHRHHRHDKRLSVEVVPVDIAPPPAPPKKLVETPIVAPTPVIQTVAPPPPIVAAPIAPPAPAAPVAAPAPPSPMIADKGGPVSIGRLSPMPGNPPLKYPTSSRMKHEEGVVRLRIVVGTSGSIEDISIAQSSGFDSLDKAAMEVVRRWRFFPPTRDGQPVTGVGIFPASFKLN